MTEDPAHMTTDDLHAQAILHRYRGRPRPLRAWLTRCPCRRLPYLDHYARDLHVRNATP